MIKNIIKTASKAAKILTIDLSNAAGIKNAEKQICAALQSNSLTDSDYALVKMVSKMISEIVVDDEVGAKLVAEGKISREYYDATAYTSEEFKTITLDNTFGMREFFDAKDLMDFAGVTEEDYHISWGKGLIRGFSFNRNAVAKAVIYALNLAGIKADGRTDYNKVEEADANEYAVSVEAQDTAVNVEIEINTNGKTKIGYDTVTFHNGKFHSVFSEKYRAAFVVDMRCIFHYCIYNENDTEVYNIREHEVSYDKFFVTIEEREGGF